MNNSRPQLFGMLAGLFLAVGLVLSSMLATTAWIKIKNSQFITAKGSTRKNVKSNLVVWKGSFTTEAPTLLEAQKKLKDAGGWVEQRTTGYRLSQTVRVESADVDRLAQLDTTPLVEQDVLFTTDPPQFLYTKVAGEKVEMLADATKDARARAEQIAEQGGRSIASLHDAEMGVFQITALHDNDTSSGGENDTSSVDKTITAVVAATFLLK